MKTDIFNSVGRVFHTVGLKLQKHSPEILIAAGMVGTVTSAIMACKATTKLSTILEPAKKDISAIHEAAENPDILPKEVNYTIQDKKKDLAIVYTQTGLKLAKLYAPAVMVGVTSLGFILASNNIMRKRNVALTAAYTAVANSFKDYRGNVIERFGKELDRELRFNVKAQEVEETVTDEKTGEEKTVKTTVMAPANPKNLSDYARCFDETCTGWERNSEQNLMFLKLQQAHANDLLNAQGYLFLNDVYKMLGIPITKAGQCVGWVRDSKSPKYKGDGFVDFGIYNLHDPQKRHFVNGYEQSIWLEFNVDGPILDLI